MPFFVQCGYYLYGVVIFWTGGYFLCTGGYFLDRWLFFGQVVIFLVHVVIFLVRWLFFVYRWLFFCTEGLCVYNILLSVMDRGFVFSLIRTYSKEITAKATSAVDSVVLWNLQVIYQGVLLTCWFCSLICGTRSKKVPLTKVCHLWVMSSEPVCLLSPSVLLFFLHLRRQLSNQNPYF